MIKQGFMPVRRRSLTRCLLAVLAVGGMDGRANSTSHTQATAPGQVRPADTLPVTSCADDGSSGTLRSVIATAVSGDTIDLTQLDCGTITLLTGQIEVHAHDLTIDGPGQDVLAIDGNYNGRVFHHDGAGTLTLNGLTVTHGLADFADLNPDQIRAGRGGCILSDNGIDNRGNVALNASTVTGCEAISTSGGSDAITIEGGGVDAGGDLTLYQTTISDNKVLCVNCITDGGGLSSRYGVVEVTNSTITRNSSVSYYSGAALFLPQAHAGGIRAYRGATISGSIVSNNFAGCYSANQTCAGAIGGGLWVDGPPGFAPVQITGSWIYGNVGEAAGPLRSPVNGAGLYATGIVSIETSTIDDNREQGQAEHRWGGGLFANGTVTISASTISNNVADVGGGIFVESGQVTLANSTISGNTATDAGGGIYAANFYPYGPLPLMIENSTITLNVSSGIHGGGGIIDNHYPALGMSDFESSIVAGNINAMSGTSYDADLGSSRPSPVISGANNVIVAATGVTLPSDTIGTDPMLGPLQDNGGPTWTQALSTDSPAIDAGNNIANLQFDQRGDGFLRRSGAAVDIGAFELQMTDGDVVFADGFDGPSL